MKLASYRADGELRAALVVGELAVDLADAAREADLERDAPRSNRELLALSAADRAAVAEAAQSLAGTGGPARDLAELELGPPIADPEKIICLGLNYRDHSAEMELEQPSAPTLFPKFRNCLIGSGEAIVLPGASREVDYEAELAVVIGTRAKHVVAERAFEHVGGYMALNDVSARDLQMETTQWTAGKVPDTFAPCGPVLVSADEVADPEGLDLVCRVNGEVVQSDNTAEMIFGIAETIAYITGLVTLEPGDIVATGTPAGVGYKRQPPLFLSDGDEVEVEIEGIGRLVNPVVAAA